MKDGELMEGKRKVPQNIYPKILSEIEKLLLALQKNSDDKQAEEYRNDAIEKLNGVKKEVVENISSLEKNSEWNTFTIAFYGETNAGKSTLIETLRILLHEHKKLDEHKSFENKKQMIVGLDQAISVQRQELTSLTENFRNSTEIIHRKKNEIQQIIEANKNSLNKVTSEIQLRIDRLEIDNKSIDEQLLDLELKKSQLDIIVLDKMISSTWGMIKSLFHKHEEQKEIDELTPLRDTIENQIIEIKKQQNQLRDKIRSKDNSAKEKDVKLKVQQEHLENEINNLNNKYQQQERIIQAEIQEVDTARQRTISDLEKLSDGYIIGDGRSDFTREVCEYHFEVEDKRFLLLDLPGIEGKEELVQASIDAAVEKAHAIFYVSRKPNPPQKGDVNNLGTIEKISRQLSKHSEVYFVYNKSVKNPRQLKEGLIDDEESNSLRTVDDVLLQTLEDNYISHKILSAYPAFVSLGDFYGGQYEKDCEKFYNKFLSSSKVLELSHVSEFSKWMTEQLVLDVENKIRISNFRKIKEVLSNTIEDVGEIQVMFSNLEDKLRANLVYTTSKLDNAGEIYERNVKNASRKSISAAKNSIRKKAYANIEKGIADNKLEGMIKSQIEEGVKSFAGNLNDEIKKCGNDFSDEISDIVATYQRYVKEIVAKNANSVKFKFDFNPKIKLKMNIDLGATAIGLVGDIISIVMVIVEATSLVGWVILAISALTTLFGVYKKVHAFFDENFHKAQQRKNVDENIEKAMAAIEKQSNNQLAGVQDEVVSGIAKVKCELSATLIQVKTMADTFSNAAAELNNLLRKITKEGEQFNGNGRAI